MSNRTKRYIDLYINGEAVENDIRSVNAAMKRLKNEQARMTIGSQEYIKKTKQIRQLDTILTKHRSEIKNTQKSWLNLSKAADGFNKYFGMLTAGAATIMGVAYSTQQWIQGNVGLSDSLANVMKTTGLTRKEVRELYTEFKYLNTRTPRKELLALAEEAGRLGKTGKKDIMEFVKVANKISVALGDDLGGNSEEATREVGKLTDNLKVGAKYGVDFGEAMNKVGSGINEVAANSKAQAGYIIEFTKRTQGLGDQADISADQLIGLAATFDESGQAVEMSATAVNKVIVDMYRDASEYAKVANMSTKEFTDLLNTDANAAFIKMLEGLQGNNQGLGVMVEKFDAMGIDGARATQALASLVGNLDRLKINQATANKAMEEGVSLTNEYNIRNENLAGNVEKVGRFIQSKFVNSGMVGWLENVVSKMARWSEIKLSEKLENEHQQLLTMAFKINDVNTSTDERLKLLGQLKDISPDIVKGIDEENINYQDLNDNIRDYNENLLTRIILQKKQEEIDDMKNLSIDKQKQAADNLSKMYDRMTEIRGELLTQSPELAAQFDEIMNSSDHLQAKVARISSLAKKNDVGTYWLDTYRYYYEESNKFSDYYKNLANNIENEKNQMIHDLGLSQKKQQSGTEKTQEKLEETSTAAETTTEKTSKLFETLEQFEAKIQAQNTKAANDALQRLDDKIAELEKIQQSVEDAMNDNSFSNEEETIIEPEIDQATTEFLEQSYDTRREILQNFFDSGVISYQEFRDKMREIDEEENEGLGAGLKNALGKIIAFAQFASDAYNAYAQMKQSQDDAEMARFEADDEQKRETLERRLKNGAISRKQYNNSIETMDKELDAKQRKMEYEAAKRKKTQALFSAIIGTAQAVLNGLNTQPFMPMGIIMGAMAGVLGGIQIAAVANQPLPAYVGGGFTNGDRIYRAGEAGTEYIAPAWQVNDPYYGSIIDDLDRARRGEQPNGLFNSISTTAAPSSRAVDVAGSIGAGASYVSSSTTNYSYNSTTSSNDKMDKLIGEVMIMNRYLSDPNNRQATISNDLKIQDEAERSAFDSLSRME